MLRFFIIKLLLLLTSAVYAQSSPPFTIHSKTSHVLYANCSNSIDVTLQTCTTAPYPAKSIKFTADNAIVTVDSVSNNTFSLTIVPNKSLSRLILNAYSNAQLLGSETFLVKNLPSPEIHLMTNGKFIDPQNGLYVLTKDISVEAVMNDDVQNITSVTAQYKVTDWEVTFIKDGKVLDKIQLRNNNLIDLRNNKNFASTDYLVISINEVKIITPKGDLNEIHHGLMIITLPIVR